MGTHSEEEQYNKKVHDVQHVWKSYNYYWHKNQGICLLFQFGVIMSVRVEEIILCVDGKILSILLNIFSSSRVFLEVGVFPGLLTKKTMFNVLD